MIEIEIRYFVPATTLSDSHISSHHTTSKHLLLFANYINIQSRQPLLLRQKRPFSLGRGHQRRASLLYPCFKTAFCYGVVSGCFVPRVSPSSRIRLELAPKRGLGGPGLAFRKPETARKVHAKTSGPKCGLAG